MAQIKSKFHLACRRRGAFCKGIISTPTRWGIVCSRLSASRSFTKGIHLYACPAWGYFSVKKSNQKSLGEDPETP